MKKISFVIPCYRSRDTIWHVVTEIDGKMEEMQEYTYEILMVNDCSPDDTMDVLKDLCNERSYGNGTRKAIGFARNFGQHAALMAGIRASDGDYVVCLDDDGQTPADQVDRLIEKLEEGYDAVYAKYLHKQHSAFRNLGSHVNELMTRIMLGKPKELFVSSYFAVKRFIADDMIRYENSYPYVIGLVLRATTNITNVMVDHREREQGASGYTIKKLFGLWFNGFTAFSVKPLRIATTVGMISAIIGFVYGIFTIIKRFLNLNHVSIGNSGIPLGWSSTMAAIVFFGGMIMVMLGLIGEYIGRIYISLNNSPQYVIREKVNLGGNGDADSEAGDARRSDGEISGYDHCS